MRVMTPAAQELDPYHRHQAGSKSLWSDLRAKKPSSSSLRVGAGKGAPGASLLDVGSLTFPSLLKGLKDCSLDRKGVEEVFAGMSGSRLDHPIEFRESRKEDEAMLADVLDSCRVDFNIASQPRLYASGKCKVSDQ